MKKILLVDDEPDLLQLLRFTLEKEGYEVTPASDGVKAWEILSDGLMPDLVVLDVLMPQMNGIDLCKKIREDNQYDQTSILMLTAKDAEQDQIEGLEAGADDYVPKSVSAKLILSRVKALLRRKVSDAIALSETLETTDFRVDLERYLVEFKSENGWKDLHFPRKEFELLCFLMRKPNKVFTREELLNRVWGTDVFVIDRTIDVHIRKIREKIGEKYIQTVKGIGYKFVY